VNRAERLQWTRDTCEGDADRVRATPPEKCSAPLVPESGGKPPSHSVDPTPEGCSVPTFLRISPSPTFLFPAFSLSLHFSVPIFLSHISFLHFPSPHISLLHFLSSHFLWRWRHSHSESGDWHSGVPRLSRFHSALLPRSPKSVYTPCCVRNTSEGIGKQCSIPISACADFALAWWRCPGCWLLGNPRETTKTRWFQVLSS